MVDLILSLLLALGLTPLLEPPDMHGLATWYGPPADMPGDAMADGTPFALDGATVAVDVSRRKLLGRRAVVLTECGKLRRVRVTDTGRLYQVGGWLRLGVRQDVLRYYPVLEGESIQGAEPVLPLPVTDRGIEWREDRAYRVVADFPRDFFADEVACQVDGWGRGETMKVWIWFP